MCGGAIKKVASVATLGLSDSILSTGEAVKAPDAVAMPTPVADVSAESTAAREDEKRRRAAAAGLSSTILGGSTAGTTTANKSLLGQ
jgi:hypothetical protein